MPGSHASTAAAFAARARRRNFPPARRRCRPRKATKRRLKPVQTPPPVVEKRARQHMRDSYNALESNVFQLFTRKEVEDEARACGFWQREPQRIRPFEFVLCCALASVLEAKRGFASVWRLLAAAVNVVVARSAVTQRFGASSAALMERLFSLAVERLPQQGHPEVLGKLSHFRTFWPRTARCCSSHRCSRSCFPPRGPTAWKAHRQPVTGHRKPHHNLRHIPAPVL